MPTNKPMSLSVCVSVGVLGSKTVSMRGAHAMLDLQTSNSLCGLSRVHADPAAVHTTLV